MADAEPGRTATTGDGGGNPGFDQILERLRRVVERLEAGNLSLEESLAAFEEGVSLSRRGASILDAAERRVEILTRGADGAERIVPFAPGDSGSSRDSGGRERERERERERGLERERDMGREDGGR